MTTMLAVLHYGFLAGLLLLLFFVMSLLRRHLDD